MKKIVFFMEFVILVILLSLVVLIGMADLGKFHFLTSQMMKNAFVTLMFVQILLILATYYGDTKSANNFFQSKSIMFNIFTLGLSGLLFVVVGRMKK